ncbi:hypothetical protein [Saccharolobus shibatae]|uniref:Uncharacterized protein n=1 Tax=Saccharolobus shibatae TaxID=2286 RepID=A0A8F5BS52_9CREN|nr:hypothetical protein [Saccharolobus shibatae]QXJ30339.1 hypothetical protein J5U21_p0081 [Saccharolobus shibatae]QXJ30441.1 hypothetical protein J5U21_00081 [Saccharolobus shibatae]
MNILITTILASITVIAINTAATIYEIKYTGGREKKRLVEQSMDVNAAILIGLIIFILSYIGILHI